VAVITALQSRVSAGGANALRGPHS
jgi:hypothetical protein